MLCQRRTDHTGYFVSLPKDRRVLLAQSIHQDAPDRIQRAGITVMAFAHYAAQCEAQLRRSNRRHHHQHHHHHHLSRTSQDLQGGRYEGNGDSSNGSGSAVGTGTDPASRHETAGENGRANVNASANVNTEEAYKEWDRRALKVAAFARQALESSSRAPGDNLGPILDLRTAFVSLISLICMVQAGGAKAEEGGASGGARRRLATATCQSTMQFRMERLPRAAAC